MHFSAAAEMTPSGVPPTPHSRSTGELSLTASIAAATSPSEMSRTRAPASRNSRMPSSWRGRSRTTTMTSRTSMSFFLATRCTVSPSGTVEVQAVGDLGPPAIFIM
jgi:hypothetical protein